ncbi:MAG: xylulokinase, partial [Nitrososphaeria archaeon]
PLINGILYNDTRSEAEIEELKRDYGELVFNVNGNPVNNQQWLPKILWFRKNMPELYRRVWKFMDLTSYIIWKLSGETKVDKTVALEEGFLDFKKNELSDKMLEISGIEREDIPDVLSTTDVASMFNFEGNHFQINSGTVDAIAAAISLGLIDDSMFEVTLGTTGIIYYSTYRPVPNERLYLDMSPVNGLYYMNGSTSSAGSFVDFVLYLLGLDSKYSMIKRSINDSKPCSSGVIALPYIAGERTPIFDPNARSVFFGLSTKTKRSDIIRASVEAVAFSIRHNIEAFRTMGYETKSTLLTGGLAKPKEVAQILADVLNSEIQLKNEASETDGDIKIAQVMSGSSWEEVKNNNSNRSKSINPIKENTVMYEKCFKKYIKIYEMLKDLF